MFIRLGAERVEVSTGVPSGRKSMSSAGDLGDTPLLPVATGHLASRR
jgi:hypothetical protein